MDELTMTCLDPIALGLATSEDLALGSDLSDGILPAAVRPGWTALA